MHPTQNMYKNSKKSKLAKQISLHPFIPEKACLKVDCRNGHTHIKSRQTSNESNVSSFDFELESLPNVIDEFDRFTSNSSGRSKKAEYKRTKSVEESTLSTNLCDDIPCIGDLMKSHHEQTMKSSDSFEKFPNNRQGFPLPGVPVGRGSITVSTGSPTVVLVPPVTISSVDNNLLTTERRKSVESRLSFIIRERVHALAGDINRRTSLIKDHMRRPPTPESDSLIDEEDATKRKESIKSLGGNEQPESPRSINSVLDVSQLVDLPNWKKGMYKCCYHKSCLPRSLDPQSRKYLLWLAFLSACFLYNAFAVPFRASYPYQTPDNLVIWMLVDYFCDIVYIIDMTIVKPRIRFMKAGLPVKTKKELRTRYIHSSDFKLDLIAILPLDILYFAPSIGPNSLLRICRLLKVRSYWQFFYMLDSLVKNPYGLRICKSLGYLVYVIHVNSCVFYSISAWEGLGSTEWTYDGQGNAYLRCFYFATKLATSIGNTATPVNVIENLYMLISWLMGVFIVAMLLGQIRDIVATANKNKEEFRKSMDDALQYCKALKLPQDVQNKVREWFIYTWREQKTLDESLMLQKLPIKLQTDLAISVHYHTLSKVQLFKDCDKALLRDLVLKLKPVLFLPNDYVCRKGEVGKEMYIVSKGILEVVGGPEGTTVFATLKEGSVFGEVSLLAVGGGNRRTADVRSKGFSNMFVLSKDDLNEAIRDYPDAQKSLRRKARELIKKHEKEEKEKKLNLEEAATLRRKRTPRLFETVASVINPNTKSGQMLKSLVEREKAKRQEKEQQVSDDESEDSDTGSHFSDMLNGLSLEDFLKNEMEA